MGLTPTYSLPYPEPPDPADVPTDMHELATAVEAAISGVSASGWQRIADQTLASAAPTIDFPAIPQTYAHLFLMASLRGDSAAGSIGAVVRANADATAGNYRSQRISSSAAVASGTENFAAGGFDLGSVNAGTSQANAFAPATLYIPQYRSAFNKCALAETFLYITGAGGQMFRYTVGSIWIAAAAISRLTFIPSAGNFAAGSRVTLYGMG